MTTLINRKEWVEKIKSKTRKDGDILCPDEFNALNHSILLLNRIGTESVNGEVYKSCTPYNKISHECEENNKILLSTKKMPLNNFQKEYFDLRDNVYSLSNLTDVNVFVELKCMQLCNSVVLNKTPMLNRARHFGISIILLLMLLYISFFNERKSFRLIGSYTQSRK